jgi:hypothetical protein
MLNMTRYQHYKEGIRFLRVAEQLVCEAAVELHDACFANDAATIPVADDIQRELASVIERLQQSTCHECGQPLAECSCSEWGRDDARDNTRAVVLI